jgi:broad specificity phosphatase PhoE
MLKLYLVRHGQTAFNAQGRLQGWLDVPLDETGLAQAQQLAQHFCDQGIQVIYASPLVRAAHTAHVIAKACGCEVILDERLREYHMGDWSGLTRAEVLALSSTPEAADVELQIPNGESAHDAHARVATWLCDLLARHAEQTVLAVSHGGVLGAMLAVMLGLPVARRQPFTFGNASVTEMHHDGRRWHVRALNSQCHLR